MLSRVELIHIFWISILLDNHKTPGFLPSTLSLQLTRLALSESHISLNAYSIASQEIKKNRIIFNPPGKGKIS